MHEEAQQPAWARDGSHAAEFGMPAHESAPAPAMTPAMRAGLAALEREFKDLLER